MHDYCQQLACKLNVAGFAGNLINLKKELLRFQKFDQLFSNHIELQHADLELTLKTKLSFKIVNSGKDFDEEVK